MVTDHILNIALLIDTDNASPSGIDPILTVFAELGQVNIRRTYGNWRKTALKSLDPTRASIQYQIFAAIRHAKGKIATNMKMTIDAMDMLYRRCVHGFGIMSSDSDFMPLAMRIR